MQSPTATLHCPNPSCHAPNAEGNQFCQKCGTWIPKHYLWPVGNEPNVGPGELLADRYLHKGNGILIDTCPGLQPEITEEIPPFIESYLKLVVRQLHVPQVYGRISSKSGESGREIWLLERAPIESSPHTVRLHPSISEAWSSASPVLQLSWLWQIARLWQPFEEVGVATSLLQPNLLRIEGSLVRLLELVSDGSNPNLVQLGRVWSAWVPQTASPLKGFLDRLCQLLGSGEIQSVQQLLALLERGLDGIDEACDRQIQLATMSDRGPNRDRNEDACYPQSGTTRTLTTDALAIVCDGVGGHEGGDVASRVAISTVEGQVKPLLEPTDGLTSESISRTLECATYEANTAIGSRNNREHRQGRQRMGTTLVMALTRDREMYLTHVGDSRAYLITRTGCYQLTLDDDVASREVRLGYALYRDALQQVASGSLIQALGMGASTALHPTIERFLLSEDAVFLLCSDGLSDYDRVEQHWEEEILPLLDGKVKPGEVARRLVEIANTENGHDNVTVALVSVRVTAKSRTRISAQSLCDRLASIPPLPSATSDGTGTAGDETAAFEETADLSSTQTIDRHPEDAPTTLAAPPKPSDSRKLLPVLITAIALFGGGAVLAYQFSPPIRQRVARLLGWETPAPSVPPEVGTAPPTPAPEVTPALEIPGTNDLIRTGGAIVLQKYTEPLADASPRTGDEAPLDIEVGSILKVVNLQEQPGEIWLELQFCSPPAAQTPSPTSTPTPTPPPEATASPTAEASDRQTGWILSADLDNAGFETVDPIAASDRLGSCDPPTSEVDERAGEAGEAGEAGGAVGPRVGERRKGTPTEGGRVKP
ncbi:MAG: protein phosphatase 2C domain-containing protein [Cyanobacteriota bacterium]|nr:protein phosphatase 2C domain-containing protein [Cyanobacteriota bacterium]